MCDCSTKPTTIKCQIIEVMGHGIGLTGAIDDVYKKVESAGHKVHELDILKIHVAAVTAVHSYQAGYKFTIDTKVSLED